MKNYSNTLASKVAALHCKYYEEFLVADKRKKPKDFKSALNFIFGISFYQGRKDSLSDKFYELAMGYVYSIEVENIKPVLKFNNSKDKKGKIEEQNYAILEELKLLGLNKEADRIMVLDIIGTANNISQKYNLNFVDYIVQEIQSGNLKYISKFLEDIYSIGPKISGLILRDIVHIYDLTSYINGLDDYSLLQPIDTWVHQVSLRIDIIQNYKIVKSEAKEITKYCLENKINPIHYNEGAWYLGSQAFKYILNSLQDLKI